MTDAEYLLQRAEQESVLAIQAQDPKAAAVHRRLSTQYSARAVIAIVDEQDSPREKARHRELVAAIRGAQSD